MFPNPADVLPIPLRPSLEQYRKRAKELVKACRSGDPDAIAVWASQWLDALAALDEGAVPNAGHAANQIAEFARARLELSCSLAGAQFVLARVHGFASWPKLAAHVEALSRRDSPLSAFEAAAEAVVAGDTATLGRLLDEHPGLAEARSSREHRATLLHYVGANGFENFRQKTPKNAVEVTRLLLDAGADVDATLGGGLGGGTTLGLVATSVHPARAGVQIELLELLVERGASVEGEPGGWNPLLAALHNGRGRAATFLAVRGARMDLEGAAGAGQLDRVRTYFAADGSLEPSTPTTKMQLGFLWACEYGHDEVVAYLLDRGADLAAEAGTGLTGLHWAVVGGRPDTVELLVARGADVERLNAYGGTALGQAVWCAANDPTIDYAPVVEALLAGGADLGSVEYPTGCAGVDEVLGRHGAT